MNPQIQIIVKSVFGFLKVIFVGVPFIFSLVSCGGGGASSSGSASGGGSTPNNGGTTNTATYTVGGTVSGLNSGSLVLNNNGTDVLTIGANTSTFTFTTPLIDGAIYAATVNTQPSGLGCFVLNGSGTIAHANITNIAVNCYPDWVGTKQMGSGLMTYGYAVATDATGSVYVAGKTTGDLDGNTHTGHTNTAGHNDLFLTKYSYSGAKQYTNQMGAGVQTTSNFNITNNTLAYSVATDASRNVYVTGYTTGDLDGHTLIGVGDLFLIKYNDSGVKQYSIQMGDAGSNAIAEAIAVDVNGNVYVAGRTDGNLDGLTKTGTIDFFLIKFDSNGVKQYTKLMGAATGFSMTMAYAVTTDASGNVYVAGTTYGDLDGNTVIGTQDFFITKYNSAGTVQYTKQLGAAASATIARSVAVDASGNVYVAGETTGNLDGNTRTGTKDFFVTKYNSAGVKQYTKQMGAASGTATIAHGVTSDSSGNVYVTGYTNGNLDGNTRAGVEDYFLTKYNNTGIKQYTRQVGVTGGSAKSKSITTDSIGNVYVAGDTNRGLDGNTTSGVDFFVAKYNSAGVKQ